MTRFSGQDQPEEDWDEAFERELFCGEHHRWYFPVAMGDWCKCGTKRWVR